MKSRVNITDERLTAAPHKSIGRVVGKILQYAARKTPFLPGNLRAGLQSLHGVNFKDWRSNFIGEDVIFDDLYPGSIYIGRGTLITTGSIILTHYLDTKFQPTPERPFRFYRGRVIIEDYVFIGANSIITKPIRIGTGAIIAANSVLTKDVEPFSIVAGNPAAKIGTRPSI